MRGSIMGLMTTNPQKGQMPPQSESPFTADIGYPMPCIVEESRGIFLQSTISFEMIISR